MVGEIIPKSYTLPRAERVALVVARPIRVFFVIFSPFIRFLDWLAQCLMRLLGIPTTDEQLESAHSEEELRLLVHRSRGVGLLEAEEEEMIGKVFDFADTEVRQVMVPRPDVVLLPIGLAPQRRDGAGARPPVHALPRVRRRRRRHRRHPARAHAVRRVAERRRRRAPTCAS